MPDILITNVLLGNGTTLTAGTEVTADQFVDWDDQWDDLVAQGAIVNDAELPALEELAIIEPDVRDQLLVLTQAIDERELHRRRLVRDGRSAADIDVILGEDTEAMEAAAAANTPTSTYPPGLQKAFDQAKAKQDREATDGNA